MNVYLMIRNQTLEYHKKRGPHKRGFKRQTTSIQWSTLPELIKNGTEILVQLELRCARINDKCHSVA